MTMYNSFQRLLYSVGAWPRTRVRGGAVSILSQDQTLAWHAASRLTHAPGKTRRVSEGTSQQKLFALYRIVTYLCFGTSGRHTFIVVFVLVLLLSCCQLPIHFLSVEQMKGTIATDYSCSRSF